MSSLSDAPVAGDGTYVPLFDPQQQALLVIDRNGEQYPVSIGEIDIWSRYCVGMGIVWGAQIGAALITLIVLVILSKREKRRSLLFWFNIFSLVLCVFRSITNVLFYTSPWNSLYIVATHDYTDVPLSAYVTSILATTSTLVLIVFVEVSLVIQANIVCTTVKRGFRLAIMALSVLAALSMITIRLWVTIWNNQQTMGEDRPWLTSLSKISGIIFCCSLCFFSLIFCGKLGLAIRSRRKMGLRQFGPMQVVFIMGTQTLVIPSILAIIDSVLPQSVTELESVVITIVCICLPLTSLWAAASVDGSRPVSHGRSQQNKPLSSVSWKRYMPGRKSTRDLEITSVEEPLSPTSRKTNSTYRTMNTNNTDKTFWDLEKGDDDRANGVGDSINRVFP